MVTGVSSYRPTGNVSPAESQNDRRYTLFQAVQSRSSAGYFASFVRLIVLRNTSPWANDAPIQPEVKRRTPPAAMSEPVASSEPTSSLYAFRGSKSSLSKNAK